MFISCKESRIENNKSFYGCFYLSGFSFDSGQSITVANALRRSLLSDCTGLAIISVQIDNVFHEYSTLSGVRDSVLDILLNFKEIILKKRKNPLNGPNGYKNKGISSVYEQVGNTFFKPVVGYLKVKGPGVIRAKDLRLPPFIQCVDPSQYIATLAEDGFLNVKFVIMEGKSYYIQKGQKSSSNSKTSFVDLDNPGKKNTKNFEKDSLSSNLSMNINEREEIINNEQVVKNYNKVESNLSSSSLDKMSDEPLDNFLEEEGETSSVYQSITKKRQNLLKQLKTLILTSEDAKKRKLSTENVFKGIPQKQVFEKKTNRFSSKEKSKQLNIDAVFNPVTKVNYIIEGMDNYIVENMYEKYKAIENLTSFIDSSTFLTNNFPYFKEIWSQKNNTMLKNSSFADENTNKSLPDSDKTTLSKDLIDYVTSLSKTELASLCTPEGNSHYKGIGLSSFTAKSQLSSQLNTDYVKDVFESNVNIYSKQIIFLEIWTNGSIHPRDALSMAFQNLAYAFNIDKSKISNPLFNNSTSYKKIIELEKLK